MQIRKLAVAALSVYELRLLDMDLRLHVHLTHIIEGGSHMRAHAGVCYMYQNGAFRPYKGVMSEATMARVKNFMLQLEGFFRSMDKSIPRTDTAILKHVETMLDRQPDNLLRHLVWLSVSAPPLKRRGQEDDDRDAELVDQAALSAGWPGALASALARTSASLLRELLSKTLITYYIEWCDTPDPRIPGFALADSCFVFDSGDEHIKFVSKSADNNIYLYLPHSLRDPVLEECSKRLEEFWFTTFWNNHAAFQCQLAAIALALRGRNVDRAFWSMGPGGVGQSLESHRLATLFGHLHAFLDLNIYYSDDELRKQSENIVGKLVVTGQEAEDGRQGLKQDLYKNTSALTLYHLGFLIQL